MGVILIPFMLLGSPGDFWPTAYAAMISTMVGSVLLLVGFGIEAKDIKHATYSQPEFRNIFLSFGNMLFAFGGNQII